MIVSASQLSLKEYRTWLERQRRRPAKRRIYYHVTFVEHLSSIQQYGLRPSKMGQCGPGVYLFDDLSYAKDMAEELFSRDGQPSALLKVRALAHPCAALLYKLKLKPPAALLEFPNRYEHVWVSSSPIIGGIHIVDIWASENKFFVLKDRWKFPRPL